MSDGPTTPRTKVAVRGDSCPCRSVCRDWSVIGAAEVYLWVDFADWCRRRPLNGDINSGQEY
jgi:hypothetical protein